MKRNLDALLIDNEHELSHPDSADKELIVTVDGKILKNRYGSCGDVKTSPEYNDLQKAILCLSLELPEAVYKDFESRWKAFAEKLS